MLTAARHFLLQTQRWDCCEILVWGLTAPLKTFPAARGAVKSALAQSSIPDVCGPSALHLPSLLPPGLEAYKPHFPDSLDS